MTEPSPLHRVVLGLMMGLFMLLWQVPHAQASSVYVLDSILKIQDGKVLAGTYDVRMSLWRKELPEEKDTFRDSNGAQVLNLQSPNFAGFSEEHVVTSATNGSFNITMGRLVELDPIFDQGTSYLQVDVKPSGTDATNWQRVMLNTTDDKLRRHIITLDDLRSTRIRFEANYGSYKGILLDKQGKPVSGDYIARLSLWGSPNADPLFDKLPDGSIRSAASNYLGYSLEVPFKPDQYGRFSLALGPFNSEFLPKTKFLCMQVEIRKADEPMSRYDLIDPDDMDDNDFDRYHIKDGKLTGHDEGDMTELGDTEKLLVSNIPGGTTSRYFELGVGDTMPVGYYEIRVRQADGKAGVLRFNAVEKIWEVSNDGIVFMPIGSFLKGTPFEDFIIGLGKDKGPFSLQFGDGLSAAKISYDPKKDAFAFNRNVDFQQNQLLNAVLENRANAPDKPVAGQQYFNTTDRQAYFYNGSRWVSMGSVTGSTSGNTTSSPAPIITSGGGTTIIQNITTAPEIRPKTAMFGTDANMTVMTPATTGKGVLSEEYDTVHDRTFYRWSTRQGNMQTMKMVMQWMVPEDYDKMQALPLQLVFRTSSAVTTENALTLTATVNGTNLPITGAAVMASEVGGDWRVVTPSMSPSLQPGDLVTFTIEMSATNNATVDIWALMVEYMGR